MSRARPTIGLLTDRIDYNYQKKILSGIMDMCERHGLNFLCYSGGPLDSPYEQETQRNAIFNLVNDATLDGILLMSGSLSNFITQGQYAKFYSRFLHLPMVSIAVPLPGIPSVVIDNRFGFVSLITHLIEKHHCSNIGFIKGPDGNPDAKVRYEVYADVLKSHGMAVNPEYVATGDFRTGSGIAAAEHLLKKGHIDISHLTSMHDGFSAGTLNVLKKRGLRVVGEQDRFLDLNAIVASNDNMAIGAMEAMTIRNILVPYDIIITGFDNQEETEFTTPPLTTVDQPLYEQGAVAVEILIDLIAGKKTNPLVTLTSSLLLRESCGCNRTILEVSVKSESAAGFVFPQEELESLFFRDTVNLRETSKIKFLPDKLRDLFDCFCTEVIGLKSRYFILSLNVLLEQEYHLRGDFSAWKTLLQKMYAHAKNNIAEPLKSSFAGELLKSGLLCIEEMAKRQQAYERMQLEFQLAELRVIVQNISSATNMDELSSSISIELKKFGIGSLFLSLYGEGGRNPAISQLIVGFKGERDYELPSHLRVFDSHCIVPPGLLDGLGQFALDIKPLYAGKDQLGFVVFNLDRSKYVFYETIRAQMSTALKSVFLFQDRKETETELEHALEALRKSHRKFKRLSIIDELTKLNNRRGFYSLATAYFNLAVRRDEEFSLLYFDLDGLKKINDTYGHNEGDFAIMEAAHILKRSFRFADILGRLGGDEFAVLCDRIGESEIGLVLERLKTEIETANAAADKPFRISLSHGVAIYNPSGGFSKIDEMMVKADLDLYERRRQARGSP